MKLSHKINLLFLLLVTCILFAVSIVVYSVIRKNIAAEFNGGLKIRATRTAQLYSSLKKDSTQMLKTLDAAAAGTFFNKTIAIYDSSKTQLHEYKTDSAKSLIKDEIWFNEAKRKNGYFFAMEGKRNLCIFYYAQLSEKFYVIIAAENATGEKYLSTLKKAFLFFFPLALLITFIIGFLFTRTIVKPIKEAIHDVTLISSQNLSKRLHQGQQKDELSQLNGTFNDLLNRLEEAFATQRRFISNASHELSTPLTSISSQIEVALMQVRSSDEYRQTLFSVQDDVRELNELTKTLLEIAKAGTHGAISLDKIRVDEILIKAHSDVLKQSPTSNIELKFPELPEDERECMIFGNHLLLQSAFKNIIENGCKYSSDNAINIELLFRENIIELFFRNNGDSISEEEINRLFEPFYRSKNAIGKPGVGLGLTLTKRIISLHKGSLTLVSNITSGTQFLISLPSLKK